MSHTADCELESQQVFLWSLCCFPNPNPVADGPTEVLSVDGLTPHERYGDNGRDQQACDDFAGFHHHTEPGPVP